MNRESTSRRRFLELALAGGAAAAATDRLSYAGPAQNATLPTIRLGQHTVTRLLLGSNPFNGFSYGIPSLDQHMKEWSTPEHIAGVVRSAEQNGINTWQFSYYDSSLAGLKLYQSAGGKIQWILLTGGAMRENPGLIPDVAKMKPIAIVHHGGVTDERFRAGQMDRVRDYLKAIRDSGVLVGLSTHLPGVIDFVEGKNWDVDFYMACFFQIGRPEAETRKITGALPLGQVFLESDPPQMCKAIRQSRKPCLAFKILAAGRHGSTREQLEAAFRFAFANIKPQDGVIVGMYPRFKDEVRENTEIVRRICAES
jgi:hypothetical protein